MPRSTKRILQEASERVVKSFVMFVAGLAAGRWQRGGGGNVLMRSFLSKSDSVQRVDPNAGSPSVELSSPALR